MAFQRVVPGSLDQLQEYLVKVHENRSHVNSMVVNPAKQAIEIDLSWAANKIGKQPDIYLPLKTGKANAAKVLIDKMLRDSDQGHPPSDSDARALFDMIDPQGA